MAAGVLAKDFSANPDRSGESYAKVIVISTAGLQYPEVNLELAVDPTQEANMVPGHLTPLGQR